MTWRSRYDSVPGSQYCRGSFLARANTIVTTAEGGYGRQVWVTANEAYDFYSKCSNELRRLRRMKKRTRDQEGIQAAIDLVLQLRRTHGKW
jgi:hypothetical protein